MSLPLRQPKRPFQPSITSYLGREASQPPRQSQSQSQPRLPTAIQVSLLNVGMRVRKAVPEGYKTKRVESLLRTPLSAHNGNGEVERPPELLPFCGMHRVGGMVQEIGGAACDDEEWVPSSQESGASVSSAWSVNPRKRGPEGDDLELGCFLDESVFAGCMDEEHQMKAARPIAQAVSRRRGLREKIVMSSGGQSAGFDFDDADFLSPMEGLL